MIAYINGLTEKHPSLFQFSKFIIVGVVNTIIDFAILNLLIFLSGKAAGGHYAVFKSFSFSVAVTNSYFMNKYWTFKLTDKAKTSEFVKFVGVNLVGLIINVGIASYVVNVVKIPSGISPVLWANIGAASAVIFTMTWNFLAMKFLIFKK